MKRFSIFVATLAVVCAFATAQDIKDPIIDLGNAKCPVMKGEDIVGISVDWEGLRIQLCCDTCVKRFNKKPEKYMKRLKGVDWEKAKEDIAAARALQGDERKAAVAKLKKSYRVVDASTPATRVYDLANTHCPLMEEALDPEKSKSLIYNGMLVHVCCPGCVKKFGKNPVGYLTAIKKSGTFVPADKLTAEANPAVLDAKNTTCPIMGKPIKDANKSPFFIHNGVKVSVCCPGCVKKAADHPAKYLAKAAQSGKVPAERMPAEPEDGFKW